jgi:hypothetical protein
LTVHRIKILERVSIDISAIQIATIHYVY